MSRPTTPADKTTNRQAYNTPLKHHGYPWIWLDPDTNLQTVGPGFRAHYGNATRLA